MVFGGEITFSTPPKTFSATNNFFPPQNFFFGGFFFFLRPKPKIGFFGGPLRPFLELPEFQTFFCPFSVLSIFGFLALPEIAHFRFEISGNRFSARARAENGGDFRHGPLPKIWCRKCLNLKHAASQAHHKNTTRCWSER